jgi:hypothetical protein
MNVIPECHGIIENLRDPKVFEVGASTPASPWKKAKKATARMPLIVLLLIIVYVTIYS